MRSEVQILPDPPTNEKGESLDQFGAIAQLGERLPCTQEVGSSILPGSTITPGTEGSEVVNDASNEKHAKFNSIGFAPRGGQAV